jgi:hypothetical protein
VDQRYPGARVAGCWPGSCDGCWPAPGGSAATGPRARAEPCRNHAVPGSGTEGSAKRSESPIELSGLGDSPRGWRLLPAAPSKRMTRSDDHAPETWDPVSGNPAAPPLFRSGTQAIVPGRRPGPVRLASPWSVTLFHGATRAMPPFYLNWLARYLLLHVDSSAAHRAASVPPVGKGSAGTSPRRPSAAGIHRPAPVPSRRLPEPLA